MKAALSKAISLVPRAKAGSKPPRFAVSLSSDNSFAKDTNDEGLFFNCSRAFLAFENAASFSPHELL